MEQMDWSYLSQFVYRENYLVEYSQIKRARWKEGILIFFLFLD